MLLLLTGSSGTGLNSSITEAASASDTPSAALTGLVSSITEAASASDSSSAVMSAAASITEAATATESSSAVGAGSFSASITEAASATEVESLSGFGVSIAEAGTATESETGAMAATASQTDAGTATATQNVNPTGAVVEAASAADASFTSRFLIDTRSFNNRYRDNMNGAGVDQYALPYTAGGSPVRNPEINGGFTTLLYDPAADPMFSFTPVDALSGNGILWNNSASGTSAQPTIPLKNGLTFPMDTGFEGVRGYYTSNGQYGGDFPPTSPNAAVQILITSQQGAVVGGAGPSVFELDLYNKTTSSTYTDEDGNIINIPAGPSLVIKSNNRTSQFGGTAQVGIRAVSLVGQGWAEDSVTTIDVWLTLVNDPNPLTGMYIQGNYKTSGGASGQTQAITLKNDPGLFMTESTQIGLNIGVDAFWINRASAADFIGTPLVGFKPLTVSFTDLSFPLPDTWSWSFGDGNTSTAQNPINLYANAGVYTVSLTVSQSSVPATVTKVAYVTVLDTGGGGGGGGGGGSVVKPPRYLIPPPPVLPVAYIIEVDEKFS